MFKLQRHSNRPSKSGEKIDFKFSHFQAIQVPKGWDKLIVSLVSVETGKTVAKSSKAAVRNGNCQWTETLSDSIEILQDDSSKDMQEYLFKFSVSMGSARSGILGEATINVASYMTSKASNNPVSLPLKKCKYGTLLQVKIQCLSLRTCLRTDAPKISSSQLEDENVSSDDMGKMSIVSGRTVQASSLVFGSNSHTGNYENRETSYSVSESDINVKSAEGSLVTPNVERHNLNGGQDAAISKNCSSADDYYPVADAPSMSNHSSFNSRITYSGDDLQKKISLAAIALPALTDAATSKDLLAAAEHTIEELRSQAKSWERHARKLTVDLDILRMEFSDQSKKHTDLEMELSAARVERDGLKKDVEMMKLKLEETISKQMAKEEMALQGVVHTRKELESEIKFHQESNADLSAQLTRSQESNIELVSVLQEHEETIEKQKVEIENFSVLELKFIDMEETIRSNLEENQSLSEQLQQLQESEKTLQVNMNFLQQALEEKNNEFENEKNLNSQTLLDMEREYKLKLSTKEEEIAIIQGKLSDFLTERHDLVEEIEDLKEKMQELERDCNELTDENLELLIKLKELNNNCNRESESFDSSSSDPPAKSLFSSESEVSELKSQIHYLEDELRRKAFEEDHLLPQENSELFDELCKQLQLAFHHIKKPCHGTSADVHDDLKSSLDNFMNSSGTYENAETIISCFVELNDLLKARISEFEEVLEHYKVEIKVRDDTIEEDKKKLEELNCSNRQLEANFIKQVKERMAERRVQIEKLEPDLLSKEEEKELLRQCHRDEDILSECLEDLGRDLMELPRTADCHASAHKVLERKSSELESRNHELELHLLELEEENLKLSEWVSGLEGQLSELTDERDSSKLQIVNLKSAATSLQDELRKLKIEDEEARQVDLSRKLQDVQNQWSKAQEECEYLKIENAKLQASNRSLSNECSALQESNGDLTNQNLELHKQCVQLETELKESQKCLTHWSKRVDDLEENLSSTLANFSQKEQALSIELDALLQENKKQKEKLVLEEGLFNRMNMEKTSEVKKLQTEVQNLAEQISVTIDERERIASEAESKVSSIQDDKNRLESALEEVHSKFKMIEDELYTVREESELKVQDLTVELASFKRKHEILIDNHEKLSGLLVNYRSSEDKLKTLVSDLELKLTVCQYERQRLVEETANLKVQLEKMAQLEDEILTLRSKLHDCGLEKKKLESSLQAMSQDYEELNTENISSAATISSLQKALSEFRDYKLKNIALEEKLLEMEDDLKSKEVLCGKDTELRNELGQMKRSNMQYQHKIQQLEETNAKLSKRVQSVEEDSKFRNEKQDRSQSGVRKNKTTKVTNQNRETRRTSKNNQAQALEEKQISLESQYQRECEDEIASRDASPHAGEDQVEKMKLLENELAEALEANNKYKVQLQRLLSEGRNIHAATSRKPTDEGEVVTKERYERIKSSLETELRDLRERYLHMSLKYAEVEAEREDLVMKLKATKTGWRWFS